MCHVLPTTLLCAALDHSFHSFSLSPCPNHNKVYIHISNQTWYALLSAFFGSYCWNICMTFTPPNAYHSVWVVFQVACLLSPASTETYTYLYPFILWMSFYISNTNLDYNTCIFVTCYTWYIGYLITWLLEYSNTWLLGYLFTW